MSTVQISKFDQRMAEAEARYSQEGYNVIKHPSDEQLPDFLIPFKPDLIAKNPLESIAVRIQATGRVQRTDFLTEFATAIKAHPGWRLDLVLERQPDKPVLGIEGPRIEKALVRQRLQEGQKLATQGMLDAALLIAWSALEAACWWAFQKEGISPARHTPAAYISRLYTEGFLDEGDYRQLTQILALRNAVAHGIQGTTIQDTDIKLMIKIARRLIGRKD